MKKVELVKEIADRTGATQGIVREVLDNLTAVIVEDVQSGGEVRLQGFGTFKPKEIKARAEREGMNLQTNEKMIVPAQDAYTSMTFKISKKLKDSFKK